MTDSPQRGPLDVQTIVPAVFEKHLRDIAGSVHQLMVSINELNRSNRLHDGAVFLAGIFSVLNALYCDADEEAAPGISIDDVVAVLAEGEGRLKTLVLQTGDHPIPALDGCRTVLVANKSDSGRSGILDYQMLETLCSATDEALIMCETRAAVSESTETLTIVAR